LKNGIEQIGEFRELLQRLLAPIRLSHETPLQFEIDGRGLASSAWQFFLFDNPALREKAEVNTAEIIAALDGLMLEALTDASSFPGNARPQANGSPDIETALADWLDTLFQEVRAIDPEAIEIMALRVEGLDNRSISEKAGTGLRLVECIVKDIWESRLALPEKTEERSC